MTEQIIVSAGAKAKERAYHFLMPARLYMRARIMAADRGLSMKEFITSALLAEVVRCEGEFSQAEKPRTSPEGKLIL